MNIATSKHLLWKARMIVITNACNMHCGGCNQLIGNFTKDQIWFIDPEQLQRQINLLKKYPNHEQPQITIFGGEPTLHPQWNHIVSILKSHAPQPFWINSNGRLGHKRYQAEDNLYWWVDKHPANQKFVQTLYASADAVELTDDLAYWEKAQKDCIIWKGCQTALYNNKAYFCETGAAIDWLYNQGVNGWDLDENKHPFIRSSKEIDEQARHCCKRCGWCVDDLIPRQSIELGGYVSPLNQISSTKHSLTILPEIAPESWDKHLLNDSHPSLGIFYIGQMPERLYHTNNVYYRTAVDHQSALAEGRSHFDWTVILSSNELIPKRALITLLNWCTDNQSYEYFSMPLYMINIDEYHEDMDEPSHKPIDVLIGFSSRSTEQLDDDLYRRLGHRQRMEGYGRAALWHDRFTTIVSGAIILDRHNIKLYYQ